MLGDRIIAPNGSFGKDRVADLQSLGKRSGRVIEGLKNEDGFKYHLFVSSCLGK